MSGNVADGRVVLNGPVISLMVAPWGTHRQGGFYDPFGHLWLVGDTSPLSRFP